MKTIKTPEDSILLIQGVTKTVKNKVKDEIGGLGFRYIENCTRG